MADASYPAELRYHEAHDWARIDGDVATFGVTSGQALSGVVGPLIEVPVLVALVYVSLAWRKKFTDVRTK